MKAIMFPRFFKLTGSLFLIFLARLTQGDMLIRGNDFAYAHAWQT